MLDKERMLSVLKIIIDDLALGLESNNKDDYFNDNAKREGKIMALSWISKKIMHGYFDIKEKIDA